jgi:hypothetical protein
MATVNKQFTRVDFSQLSDSLTTNTAVSDAFGASGKLYFIFVGSSGAAASGSFDYLKLFDAKDQVDTAADSPDFILPITYGVNEVFHFPDGLTFSNGVGYFASNAGGTGAGSNPGRTLTVQMVFK